MIRKIRSSRGFTLVELMIVVAIVGILAALAIYGVRKYITNAKTAEARNSLGQLSKDASGAYNREGMAGTVLTVGNSTLITNQLCTTSTTVPATKAGIAAKKYQSSPADWADGTQFASWACLKFSMQDPQYFMYSYTQAGSTSAAGGTFDAIANGDLNGDGTLSTFDIKGSLQAASGITVVTLAPNITETAADE